MCQPLKAEGLNKLSLIGPETDVMRGLRENVAKDQPAGIVAPLSEREQLCLWHCANGLTDEGIAERLNVTRHTVRFHISNILVKLSAANRTHAVFIGCREGII